VLARTSSTADGGTLSESATVTSVTGLTASDLATLAEASALTVITSKSATDSATLSEVSALTVATGKVGSDGGSLVEAAQVTVALSTADTGTLGEDVQHSCTSTLGDAAVLTETATVTKTSSEAERDGVDGAVLTERAYRRVLGIEREHVTSGAPSVADVHGTPIVLPTPVARVPVAAGGPRAGTPTH
jgi:hypothetical protein